MELNLYAEQNYNPHLARYILSGEGSNVNCLPHPRLKLHIASAMIGFRSSITLSFNNMLSEHDMGFSRSWLQQKHLLKVRSLPMVRQGWEWNSQMSTQPKQQA